MAGTRKPRRQLGGAATQLLVLLLIVVGGGWVWWRYAPETLPEFVRAQIVKPLQQVANPPAPNPPLYKWKDDKGQWNITDRPPEGRAYEMVVVDPDTNVLPTGAAPERD